MIDIVDESDNLTGISKMKSEAHRDGSWHRAVHIWIYNSRGEILLQLRAKGKLLYPAMWDVSAAGHVSTGEDPLTSGIRELKEEIGIDAKPENLRFFQVRKNSAVYKDIENNEFYYVYLLRYDGDVSKLDLQTEEVEEIRFIPIANIEADLKSNPDKFVPHGDYWHDAINKIKSIADSKIG